MTKDLEVIQIDGSDVELTVGQVAEDLGLLAEIENEQQELAKDVQAKVNGKLKEHTIFAAKILQEFVDALDPALQLHFSEVARVRDQHEKNTLASIEGIAAGLAPEQERLAEQAGDQKESIKAAVLAHGSTIKGNGKMAVYSGGSSKVDLKKFEKHIKSLIKAEDYANAKLFTEMIIDGKPSVSFRKHEVKND